MLASLPRFRAGLVALALAVSPLANAQARTITVKPTGHPDDYARVKAAVAGLVPGDTLHLATGIFDWSAGLADSTGPAGMATGLPLAVGRITLEGEAGTILRGATTSAGVVVTPARGSNAAFCNSPGADDITLRNLVFEKFENAVVLIQADTLTWVRPVDAFRRGTSGWTFENLTIRGGPFGIAANGRHQRLLVLNCRFELDPGPKQARVRQGSFAVSVRPYPPVYGGLPTDVTIQNNSIRGIGWNGPAGTFSGIIVTGDRCRITGNEIQRTGIGIIVEGRKAVVTGNRIDHCALGLVAWTTRRLGTVSDSLRVEGNSFKSMQRGAGGIFSAYSGVGMLLAGVFNSEISRNTFTSNPASDIVFGTVHTTPPSDRNRLIGNSGSVLISRQSIPYNTIEGSRIIAINQTPPKKKDTLKLVPVTGDSASAKKPPKP